MSLTAEGSVWTASRKADLSTRFELPLFLLGQLASVSGALRGNGLSASANTSRVERPLGCSEHSSVGVSQRTPLEGPLPRRRAMTMP